MDIVEIRKSYPQYDAMSDAELAYRLWDKDYKGKLPMGQFADKIKLPQNTFGEMIGFAKSEGYEPTTQTATPGYTPAGSTPRALLQGMTLGAGDEIVGAGAAAIDKITGSDQSFGQLYNQYAGNERQMLEQNEQANPKSALATQIAGGIVSPANAMRAPAALMKLGAPARAAVTGGVAGATEGFLSGEGGVGERAKNAIEVGIPSALFGAGAQKIMKFGSEKVANAFRKAAERPSTETLRSAKNAAYDAVEASGVKFSPDAISGLLQKAKTAAKDHNYVEDVDRQTYASLRMLENQAGKPLSIGELDKLRQGLWSRYNSSNEPAIRQMIDDVDELIEALPETDDLMKAARVANQRYKKTELLEEAFTKAERQTASTGSGGNIYNKYKQAVTSILSNPKTAKWFSAAEKEQMDKFINGSLSDSVLRKIGKLSPDGNGLMLALNIGAVAANPLMAIATVGGSASKAMADRSARQGVEGLLDNAAMGVQPPPLQFPYLSGLSVPGAVGAGEMTEDNSNSMIRR